jgi:hypothetical protein
VWVLVSGRGVFADPVAAGSSMSFYGGPDAQGAGAARMRFALCPPGQALVDHLAALAVPGNSSGPRALSSNFAAPLPPDASSLESGGAAVESVPESATLILLGTGLALIARSLGRRRGSPQSNASDSDADDEADDGAKAEAGAD